MKTLSNQTEKPNPDNQHRPIEPLPEAVISQIAAGEVIERPAFVVKELIENALDAGADRIQISLHNGGTDGIQVTDTGWGMTSQELCQAVLPHTTSKLRTLEDLMSLTSFGFRGEALNSIAAVSHTTIRSRPAHSASGKQLTIDHGKVGRPTTIGMAPGTSIAVRQLFGQIPARRKFLRSAAHELRLTVSIVSELAMAHPQVAFRLVHQQQVLLDLPVQNSAQRIEALLGQSVFERMLPVCLAVEPYGTVTGYLGKPLSTVSSGRRWLFVNNRPVVHQGLMQTVKQAFGTLLEPRAQPSCVLFCWLDTALIDVNIHPRKTELKIHQEEALHKAVYDHVQQVLQEHDLVKRMPRTERDLIHDGGTRSYAAQTVRNQVQKTGLESLTVAKPTQVIQIHGCYLVVETPDGVILIDQHAAHERVMYERYCSVLLDESSNPEKQQLEPAVMVQLSTDDQLLLEEHAQELAQLGFQIESFGGGAIKLSWIPALLCDQQPEAVITHLIADLKEDAAGIRIDRKLHRMVLYLACRSSIKAGDRLTQDQAVQLIRDLSQTRTPETCPHGRPTQVRLSINDLGQLFHRR